MFQLLVFIVYVAFAVLGGLTASPEDPAGMFSGFFGILLIVFLLGTIVPAIAVQVRRFHDQDKSGWFVLLNFIPFIGGLIVLVMMCMEGTPGPNQYGPDPLGRNGDPLGGIDEQRSRGVNIR